MQLIDVIDYVFAGYRESRLRSPCLRRTVHASLLKVMKDEDEPYLWISPTFTNTQPYGRCYIVDGRCVSCRHAEENLVEYMRQGSLSNGLVCADYRPCQHCVNVLRWAGVRDIIYSDDNGREWPPMLQRVYVPKLNELGLTYVRIR